MRDSTTGAVYENEGRFPRVAVRSPLRSLLAIVAVIVACAGCGQSSSKPRHSSNSNESTRPVAKKSIASGAAQAKVTRRTEAPETPAIETPVVSDAGESVVAPSRPQQTYRPDDPRPKHDDRRLAELGIRSFESKRLKLYTDIDAEAARTLPGIIDEVYLAWIDYFGSLPPDRAGTDFQMTGYLIKDESLFRDAGLVPEDLPMFEHGRHRRNEFWMREQQHDYFRRHLLIHEATHCFMTYMPQVQAPVWYIEGMAEHFGTHQNQQDGAVSFRVMPATSELFPGWGRIRAIREETAAGRAMSIGSLIALQPVQFLKAEQYAWAWALCQFLDAHPRYRDRFRKLGGHLEGGAFAREFAAAFEAEADDLNLEWTLFILNLQYGYDVPRAAISFKEGARFTPENPAFRCDISADRGWQSSGLLVEAGQSYEIKASGRFTLAEQPKPWVSEPQGITYRYFDGRPLGLLLGTFRASADASKVQDEPMLKDIEIGRGRIVKASVTGTMYLRVNDAWNSLHDNRGTVSVEMNQVRIGS